MYDIDKALHLHKKWINGDDGGVKADLSGVVLCGVDLTRVDLRMAVLAGADLTESRLIEANLYKADLSGSRLTGSILRGANLREADLDSADLSEADLQGVNLIGASLVSTDLCGALLSWAQLADSDFTDVELYGADTEFTALFTFTAGKHFGYYVPWMKYLKIGCMGRPLEVWKTDYKAIGYDNNYDELHIARYGRIIEMLEALYS